jgi:hypothetical protein
MISRCGEKRINHWAHRSDHNCDHWWENETPWHRWWKGHFPNEWQEVIHIAADGELHFADVKTDQGWVLEFQHSYLKPEERRARDAFYPNLVWIVDGTRRKRDAVQFSKALNARPPVIPKPLMFKVFPEECSILQEWDECRGSVIFDFGEPSRVWWLFPKVPEGRFVGEFSRQNFIALHRGGAKETASDFGAFVRDFPGLISKLLQTQAHNQRVMQRNQQRRNDPLRRLGF